MLILCCSHFINYLWVQFLHNFVETFLGWLAGSKNGETNGLSPIGGWLMCTLTDVENGIFGNDLHVKLNIERMYMYLSSMGHLIALVNSWY